MNERSGLSVTWQTVGLQVGGCRIPVQCVPQPHITWRVPENSTYSRAILASIIETVSPRQTYYSPPQPKEFASYLMSPSHCWIISFLTLPLSFFPLKSVLYHDLFRKTRVLFGQNTECFTHFCGAPEGTKGYRTAHESSFHKRGRT